MDKPDFARYSEEQLRQILTRIDRERFPERVEEIQARLAQFEADRLARGQTDEPEQPDGPAGIAGFWQRAFAYLIDFVVLGVMGYGLGLLLGDQFEAMGAWGRAVGFVITLAYFGTMESRLFQGSTFGKLGLGIKVVTTAGAPLGLGQALLRSAVFHVPFFLNNLVLGSGDSGFVLPAIQALLVFGLGGAIAYLYVFNRRTRQSVHDLLVGAVVVRAATAAAPPMLPVWRGHFAVIAALLAAVTGGAATLYSMFGNSVIQPLLLVQRQVSGMPVVRAAGVFTGVTVVNGDTRTSHMMITVLTRTASVDEQALARKIAAVALATYPPARQLDILAVSITHGYDIGIASRWNVRTIKAPPGEWHLEPAAND